MRPREPGLPITGRGGRPGRAGAGPLRGQTVRMLARPWWRWGLGLTVLSVALACAWASSQAQPGLHRVSLDPVRTVWGLPLIVLLWCVNLSISAWLVHHQTRMAARPGQATPDGGVSLAVTVVAGLLNYLPVPKAGWIGRGAFLKRRYGLSLKRLSLPVLLGAAWGGGTLLVLSLQVWAWRDGAAVVGAAEPGFNGATLVVLLVATLATAAMGAVLGGLVGRRRPALRPGRLQWWAGLRCAALWASAGRLAVWLMLLGAPTGLSDCLLWAAAGLLLRLSGLTPAGLGLAEAASLSLAAAMHSAGLEVLALALLLDRVTDLLLHALCGLWAFPRLR